MSGEDFDWERAVLDRSPEGIVYNDGGHKVEVRTQLAPLPRGAGVAGQTVVAGLVAAPHPFAQ